MDRPAIIAEGIEKSFGQVRALDGIDLSVPPATILALLGPNGAGKTTAVRILTTLIEPDGGRAEVAGYDVVRDAVPLRFVIGLAGQNAAVDEHLTGFENLDADSEFVDNVPQELHGAALGAILHSLHSCRDGTTNNGNCARRDAEGSRLSPAAIRRPRRTEFRCAKH